MSIISRLLPSLGTTALVAFATTISWVGPTTTSGVPCAIGDSRCVIGGAQYNIYGVQLTQPTPGNSLWTLTIETNYPATITGDTIPPALWSDGLLYSIADFIISWNGHDYGVVLAQHISGGNSVDSYVAGNLYQAPNTVPDLVPSGTNNLLGTGGVIPSSPRPNFPIWLAPGGTQLGAGTVTVAHTGNGTPAQYTITDQFSAPADFLASGDFTIDASSWACANGIIVGSGNFEVPEPGALSLFASGVAVLLFGLRRRRNRATR